jgi:hypothetical protein
MLRHFQGLSLAEIAQELDCTTAAVTGFLQRGLKNLHHSLAEGYESRVLHHATSKCKLSFTTFCKPSMPGNPDGRVIVSGSLDKTLKV